MFQDHLARRAAKITRDSLAAVTAEDWRTRRPEVRRQLLSMLGLNPLPPRTSLRARVTRTFERERYRVENIVFESMPHLYVTANLYVPRQTMGRAPAVRYVCGHEPAPYGAKVAYQHHGIWLASHGYVAFVIDPVEFGEVPGIHHGLANLDMWEWLSLGYTPAGPEVWNAMRALDYLETRPEVDRARMAVTGISGGGAITWYTAALDERVCAAAAVCSAWTAEHAVALDTVSKNCDCIFFPNTYRCDLSSAGVLIAPRPFQILSARRDIAFPPAGYRESFRRTLPVFDLYGAREKLAEYDYDARHSDILPFRKEAYEWLNRWLKADASPYDEGEIRREDPAALTVLNGPPADAINDEIHNRFIPAWRLRPWKTLDEWKRRRTGLLARLKDTVFRAFPQENVPFDSWKVSMNGWPLRYADASAVEFTTEEGVRVTGTLFVPRNTAARGESAHLYQGPGRSSVPGGLRPRPVRSQPAGRPDAAAARGRLPADHGGDGHYQTDLRAGRSHSGIDATLGLAPFRGLPDRGRAAATSQHHRLRPQTDGAPRALRRRARPADHARGSGQPALKPLAGSSAVEHPSRDRSSRSRGARRAPGSYFRAVAAGCVPVHAFHLRAVRQCVAPSRIAWPRPGQRIAALKKRL